MEKRFNQSIIDTKSDGYKMTFNVTWIYDNITP